MMNLRLSPTLLRPRLLFTLFLSLGMLVATAQQESPAAKLTAENFRKFYNDAQYERIYALFSPEAKAALPADKTNAFLTQLNGRYGKIVAMAYTSLQSNFYGYSTTFEKGRVLLNFAVDGNQQITGLFAKPIEDAVAPKLARNLTPMRLPFNGEWAVFWGGDTQEQNYHVTVPFQKNAFDIIITDASGKSYRTDGKRNTDYYAFGQPLFAPCDGEVVMAVDGIKDNEPGKTNPIFATGNSILIKTRNNEYVLLAHLRHGSMKVKEGDVVKAGQPLGLCGNSGNSSEPHLHFHLQDGEAFTTSQGVKCYFDQLMVNGAAKADYSPVKGEKVHLK